MRVALADDSVLFREGLAGMLEQRGFEVVARAGDGEGLLDAVAGQEPDLVVADVRMPPGQSTEGLEAARKIRELHPRVGAVLLSQVVETHHAMELLGAPGGRLGYLLKDRVASLSEFEAALREVGEGGTVIDPEVVATIFRRQRVHDPLDELSEREVSILALMAQGRSNRGICEELVLSPRTVESHVRNIFMKLDLPPAPEDHRRVLAVLHFLRT